MHIHFKTVPGFTRYVLLATCVVGLLGSCSENGSIAPTKAVYVVRRNATNCGASYSLTIQDDDPLMDPYGDGYSSATLNVCETWVGDDYNVFAQVASSTDNEADVTDEVQGANYQGGSITPYGADGAAITDPTPVVSNAFDLMLADANTRQASYDDPYYGIRSAPDPPPDCGTQFFCLRDDRIGNASAVSLPITRRGVRALIAQTLELPLGSGGERRFQSRKGEAETILSVDPVTQLLVGQEVTTPTQALRARLFWTRVPKGWVRERTEITSTEVINGKPVTSKSTVTVSNFQTNDWGN
jgi:hypothetical protein